MANDEPAAKKKNKRPRGIAEPVLGFGRDLEIPIASPLPRQAAVSILLVALAFVTWWVASTRDGDDGRAGLMKVLAALLAGVAVWVFARAMRHRDRTDFVVRLTDRELDIPRFDLFGPERFVCPLRDLGPASLMSGRNGLWIEAQPFHGPRIVMPSAWFTQAAPMNEVFWRLAMRIAIARRTGGEVSRAAIVGSEAMVALGTPEKPIVGVVLSRAESKKPIVIATVADVGEFFKRLGEYPEDAKLVVPDDVRAAMLDAISDPGRLV